MANTIKTFDILPNRLEYFERRMEKVRNAALNARPPIDFFVRMGNAKTVPLPQHLISLAQANQLADTVKIGNDWFREVIPIEVEFGDLTNLGFDYIGEIQYAADIKNTQTGEVKSGFFPTIVQPIGMTDAVHAKRVAKMAPQLNAMAAKFTDYKSIGCDHCNPDGDSIERHSVYIVQSTKDQVRQGGRKGSKGFKMNLKKDDILQLGTGCMDTYTGIDVNALAAFYEMDYAVSARGPNGSPNNPAGWGWKDMGIIDFADRLVRYFGMREQQWLKSSGTPNSIWEVESADLLYGRGSMAKLFDGNVADGEGCFIEAKGGMLMQARMFNLFENDPTKEAKWLLQPFASKKGGVETMQQLWEAGEQQYGEFKEVIEINPLTGNPTIDPVTGDAKMIETLVPSTSYIEQMLRPTRGSYGRYGKRGEWALTIVEVLPPALDSKYVENTRNRMLEWIKTADPKKIQNGEVADLIQRLKSMCDIGYVGPKSIKYATELWRAFSHADFDRRKKASKKEDTKLMKTVNEAKLLALGFQVAGMKWYKVKEGEKDYMQQYAKTIYPNTNPYYSYRPSDALKAAWSSKFEMVMMTPAQHTAFGNFVEDLKKEEAKERDRQKAISIYRKELNRIQNEGYNARYTDGYPSNRSIPYQPTESEFLALLGWNLVANEYIGNNGLWTIDNNTGAVSQAKLNDKQFEMVKDRFRPQVMVQGQVISPTSSTPAPSTTSNTRPKIAQAAAKRMGYDARGISTHQGYKGGLIPLVEGYVTFVSRPFYRRGMGGAGHTVTIINPDTQNAYVVFYYGQDLPIAGHYYNLFDVDVESHTSYQNLNQTVLKDSAGGQITFTDATS
jgi:hypothetical protein|tara:strand:- start:1954 stop:4473 length:2520 start_codon:yes stop_codon:yes gene_type:complete